MGGAKEPSSDEITFQLLQRLHNNMNPSDRTSGQPRPQGHAGWDRVACSNTWTLDLIRSMRTAHFQAASCTQMKNKKADRGTEPERHSADLQRHSDCPADWCTPQRHSLSPEEEEPSQSSTGEIKC